MVKDGPGEHSNDTSSNSANPLLNPLPNEHVNLTFKLIPNIFVVHACKSLKPIMIYDPSCPSLNTNVWPSVTVCSSEHVRTFVWGAKEDREGRNEERTKE